jgi:hypothetical protein
MVGLGGCGSNPLPEIGLRYFDHQLIVAMVGFPPEAGSALEFSMARATEAFSRADRGRVKLRTVQAAAPPSTWFVCGPPSALESCGPAAADASPLQILQNAQLRGEDGAPILVSGRTALGVPYGSTLLPVPRAATIHAVTPDIVVAWDVWAYWVGTLASDITSGWKVYQGDVAGLSPSIRSRQACPVPGRGWVSCGVPILRNPMVLSAPRGADFGTETPPTWDDLVSVVTRLGGSVFGVALSAYYPWPAELALAILRGVGGGVSGGGTDSTALSLAAALLYRLRAMSVGGGSFNLGAGYMWPPFWANGYSACDSGQVLLGLPSGSVVRSVPCTYVLATVSSQSQQTQLAMNFAFFLASPAGQEVLSQANAGLVLRQVQAVAQLERFYPCTAGGRTHSELSDAAADLSAFQLASPGGAGAVRSLYHNVDAFIALTEGASE